MPEISRPFQNQGAGNAGRPMRPAVSCEASTFFGESAETLVKLLPLITEKWIDQSEKQFISERFSFLLRLQNPDGSFGPITSGPRDPWSLEGNSIWGLLAITVAERHLPDLDPKHKRDVLTFLGRYLNSSSEYGRQLWLMEWAALLICLSTAFGSKLSSDEAKKIRILAASTKNSKLALEDFPSDIPSVYRPYYTHLLAAPKRTASVRRLVVWAKEHSWVWPIIGAACAFLGIGLKLLGY